MNLAAILEGYAYDGTEVHDAVDRELCGLEHGVTAMRIKAAIEAKYRNTISLDATIEIVMALLEAEEFRP